MGTLTKKLHVLKSGGTEDTCNIYTTPEEVGGSPYLALEVDGQKGYVKLGSTTDANATHLRVKKNGVTYAAWKEAEVAVPTGSVTLGLGTHTFTVPEGVTNINVLGDNEIGDGWNIGVSPRTTHSLVVRSFTEEDPEQGEINILYLNCYTHDRMEWDSIAEAHTFTLSWSPEINKRTPDITDY